MANRLPNLFNLGFYFLTSALALTAVRADAECLALKWAFNNPTPESYDAFGYALAISGNLVLIGAVGDDVGGTAYLFSAETGSLLHTISNPDPQHSDNFGYTVAISGAIALIGAPFDSKSAYASGRVYLFNATTGALIRTINNPNPAPYDLFGRSVSISGNNVLVGAFFDDLTAVDGGGAYLFDASSGSLLNTFSSPNQTAGDSFGTVAISGNSILVSSALAGVGAVAAGAAYRFDTASGSLLNTYLNPTPERGEEFGFSVAIEGTRAVIGTPFDNKGASESGSAYLFDSTTGSLLQTFHNPTPAEKDNFGYSVSVSGNHVLVGAHRDDTGAINAGAAYLFDATTGLLIDTLIPPKQTSSNAFGQSVVIEGSNVLVGSPGKATSTSIGGIVYLYSISPCPSKSEILDYILGRTSSPQELDTNADGVVDTGDFTKILAGDIAG